MADSKHCADCQQIRPLEAFQKTRAGAGRSDRCKDCIEVRAQAHRADKRREVEEEDAELEAFLSDASNHSRTVPNHLAAAFKRLEQVPKRNRKEPALSNRPQMASCSGCGESIPKRDFFEYRRGGRSNYCKPCMKRRATERECADCMETKLTHEFFAGLDGHSPYCCACRDKREREKHCPKCDVTKSVDEFNRSGGRPSGWCKPCMVNAQRERRRACRTSND